MIDKLDGSSDKTQTIVVNDIAFDDLQDMIQLVYTQNVNVEEGRMDRLIEALQLYEIDFAVRTDALVPAAADDANINEGEIDPARSASTMLNVQELDSLTTIEDSTTNIADFESIIGATPTEGISELDLICDVPNDLQAALTSTGDGDDEECQPSTSKKRKIEEAPTEANQLGSANEINTNAADGMDDTASKVPLAVIDTNCAQQTPPQPPTSADVQKEMEERKDEDESTSKENDANESPQAAVDGAESAPWKCKFCPKVLKSQKNLKRHVRCCTMNPRKKKKGFTY